MGGGGRTGEIDIIIFLILSVRAFYFQFQSDTSYVENQTKHSNFTILKGSKNPIIFFIFRMIWIWKLTDAQSCFIKYTTCRYATQ